MRVSRRAIVLLFAVTIALPAKSGAVVYVDACTDVCTGNCELDRDLTCCSDAELCPHGLGPIQLSNGADLDLKGHNIECACGRLTCIGGSNNNVACSVSSECPGGTCGNDTGCTSCTSLVRINDANSIVKDSGNGSDRGYLTGTATVGVDCQSKSGSRVTGVKFIGTYGGGTLNCAKVDENVFIPDPWNGWGPTATAIQTSGVASSDFIRDNYVDEYQVGILVTGSQPLTVENNLISLRKYVMDFSGVRGIDVSGYSSTGLTVQNNVDMGTQGTPIVGDAGATLNFNYCDDLNANASACSNPTAPFTLP